ncbi:hypothetical protein GCM10023188_46870 [Pontibacter saemangeumensis]|uniref:Uncharacterized protein n=1 Tax=Pontibacter saemangeumensis TaxID=1084525 RepID=A0ABP8M789_9BACT
MNNENLKKVKKKRIQSPKSQRYWVIDVFAFLTCFAAMFGLGAVSFDNILKSTQFFIVFAFAGFLFSLILVLVLFSILPEFKVYEKNSKYVSTSLIFIGLTMLVPEISAFTNDKLSSTAECSDYLIERKSSGGRRTKAHWLYVTINGKEERIELYKPKWERYKENGLISLCIARGFLGFEFIRISNK